MSIKDNFPSLGPSLSLNFARSKTLDPRITFARPSTSGDATYTNGNGLIVTAAADEPRFDHKIENGVIKSLGLLVEESRTNLLLRSEKFDTTWGLSNINSFGSGSTANATQAPDGNLTADLVTETLDASNTQHNISQGINVSSGTVYTISLFAKLPVGSTRQLQILIANTNFTVTPAANFNLISGSVVSSSNSTASIVPYPNGWYRLIVTTIPATSSGLNGFNFRFYDGSSNSYIGDGTSGIYLWGAQLEADSFPTSYIPTEGSQATRSPDSVSMTGTNFSDWYNQDEGTVYADTRMVGVETGRYDRLWAITSSNLNYEGISVFVAGPAGVQGGYVSSITILNSATEEVTEEVTGTIDVSAITTPKLKSAFAFKQNDCASGYNGDLKFVDNTVGLSSFTTSPDRLLIGQPQRFQGYPCMTISQLTYYPKRLTNTQLQNLTK